jgi:type IV secretion system protein VirB4
MAIAKDKPKPWAHPAGQAPPTAVVKNIKSSNDLETFRDIADDVIESDFVPYAGLFDAHSIATKDGELLQIIKINGLDFEGGANVDLRATIRQAISDSIPGTDYAIWLTTLRRTRSLLKKSHFADAFSGKVDGAWQQKHPVAASFVNELYISVVKAGDGASIYSPQQFLQSLWPPRDRAIRTAQMDAALVELNATTGRMLEKLKDFGARRLTVVERDGVFYGEHIEFLEKLINLEERPMEAPLQGLSHVLTSGEITFGHNAMEVRTAANQRRFAAILTLKEYKESTLAGIDQFLEIPCELIVSQCFDFTGGAHARDHYAKQARYLTISGDKELAKWIEIDRLMQRQTVSAQAFGRQQTTIFLIAPTVAQMEANVKIVQKSLNRLGMVVVREDLRFEECYWSQLPANFSFITRSNSIDTEHLAGFANLQTAPMGNASGSAWGAPISLFTTVQGAPYFYNFHRDAAAGSSGHTMVLGKPGAGRTSLMHFLMAQARKLPLTTWYIDAHGRGGPMVNAMGGTVVRVGTPECKLNPFQMPDSQANRDFLAFWISTLVDPYGAQLNAGTLAFFQSLVDQVMAWPAPMRRLSNLIPLAREADPVLAATLQQFCAGGAYGELFDMPEDTLSFGSLTCVDISRYASDHQALVPLSSYLLHRMTTQLNGQPTLLVLDEAFTVLNTPIYSMRVTGWLDYLASRNAVALMSTDAIETSGSRLFSAALSARAATIFALPDAAPEMEYITGFGLSESEVAGLTVIKEREIFMKRGAEGVVLTFNLTGFDAAVLGLLSGRATKAALSPEEQLAALMGLTRP